MISRLDRRSSINFHLYFSMSFSSHYNFQQSSQCPWGLQSIYPQTICFIFGLVIVELWWWLTCYNWSSCGFILIFFKYFYSSSINFNNTPSVFLGFFSTYPQAICFIFGDVIVVIVLVELCLWTCWQLTFNLFLVGVPREVSGMALFNFYT